MSFVRNITKKLFGDVVFFSEPFDAACGVYQFLFAGEEGVAGGAYLNLDILGCGTGLYHVAAGAGYLCHFILGMNLAFHFYPPKICPTPLGGLRA